MLLRGGRREFEFEGAVVALEVDGEGVEVGGEDDDAVVAAKPAPAEGSAISVNEDMCATRLRQGSSNQNVKDSGVLCIYGFLKEVFVRDDPADRWR